MDQHETYQPDQVTYPMSPGISGLPGAKARRWSQSNGETVKTQKNRCQNEQAALQFIFRSKVR